MNTSSVLRPLLRAGLLASTLLLVARCGDASEAETSDTEPLASSGSEPSSASSEPASAEPAPEAEPPPAAEAAPPAPPPVPEGLALVRRILAEDDALARAVDPALGITLVRYEEAGPNGGRDRKTQAHVCSAQLARRSAEIRTLLRTATEQAPTDEEWTCSETECSAPGMEWRPTIHVRFARVAEGALVVEAVMSISEAALGEEWLTAASTFAEHALTTSRAHPCPPPRR